MLKSNFDSIDGKLSSVALLLKISENLLEPKLFKMSRKRPYFEKNHLCTCLIYACTYFAHGSQETFIKIRTFLKKIDSYLEKHKFARRFEGLRLNQIS